jgi:hypothetical protein
MTDSSPRSVGDLELIHWERPDGRLELCDPENTDAYIRGRTLEVRR